MPKWLKYSLLSLLAVALCWGGAIWFWRATNRMPATEDLVIYLILLPLGLLLAVWLGRKLIAVIAAAPAAASAGAPANDVAAPPPVPPAPLAILASALRNPHGASPDELSAALLEGKARPELDAQLVDDNGFPVMTARSEEAEDTGLEEEITEWFAAEGAPEPTFKDEHWRALTMATAVARDLAGAAVGALVLADVQPPMLHLLPLLPGEWTFEERRAGGLWLRHVVGQAGWPQTRIALAAEVAVDARGASPAAVLGRLAHQRTLSGAPLVGLIVAAASHVGQASVDKWETNNVLFAAARPQGLIPGEGAAGLLLVDMDQAVALEGEKYALLHLEPEARRHNSADESKKADARLLGTMTENVLESSLTVAPKVAMLVSDTGHRTSRVLELMELAGSELAHLDLDADLLRVGGACGTCGAVPFMTALALARHHAIELDAPVLCISNEDPYRRGAVLIRPPAAALS